MTEVDIDMVKHIMSLVMIEDDPSKYMEDIKMILDLFDRLDGFDEHIRDLEPLYHPLEACGRLREDEAVDSDIPYPSCSEYKWEEYIEAPPIKGKREL